MMMIIGIFIVVGLFMVQLLKIKIITKDYYAMKSRYQKMESAYLSKITMLNAYNTALQKENLILKNKKNEQKIIYQTVAISDGVLDAVKIAMKVSHPDNGGKTEDFIKYNKLYKKLSK